ncbi:beta-glucan synthesis-associated protein [Elasticomyces elasticus]|nr:beta-glucan synthesis-associated protein [Elasticomyces elasticus]KAK3666935.1 beta-glucan synthesis-associated protein [Elasticomyces elasticus]KAK4933363.1 beta-glucan synthesis-associated protein [Elasticomyces elasticus]KAK5755545.1 beta-glucan synthesis-associated protein [Elasticomyces elasticus]
MAPSRPPPASRSSSRASSYHTDAAIEDDGQVYQAGRSPANIAAQASAQTLREASRSQPVRTPSRSSSSPNLLRKQRPGSPHVALPIHEERSQPQMLHPAMRQAYDPSVSSPLNPVASSSLSEPSAVPSASRKNSDEGASTASSDSATRSKAATAAGTALAAQIVASTPSGSNTPMLRQPMLRNPEMLHATESSLSLTRQTTPRTVRDLGSDYTRYFNPFASQNTSQLDLNSPLPRYNSSTHLMVGAGISSTDLSKRLSNPFQDSKRLSDPFHSRPQTSPGTPMPMLHMQYSPSQEKKGAAAAVVPSAPQTPLVNTDGVPERVGTPAMIRDADPEKAGFFPFMDDRLGAPDYAFPLYSDQKEEDDDLHMPQWDDDIKLKPSIKDHFTRENVASTLGMIFMVAGLLCIFVILPVISYTGSGLLDYTYETPLSQMPKGRGSHSEPWAVINNKTYPLMTNMRSELIDPDTPNAAKTRKGVNGDEYVLVFSDEFNDKNRSFYPGDDPYWTAGDFWYGGTQDMEWYDPDAINTGDGTLQIQLDEFHNHNLNYRSGMLNSWNQLCFKGGIFEVSMSLPGPAGVHGLWPGAWTMGNLGRPGYLATSEGLWPYTYNECDAGITPNQSSPDGISNQPGQRLASCVCEGEDHPSPGTGRGAPEIDIAEVSGDWGGMGLGVATQSYQVAPYDIWYYPNYDFMETPNYDFSFVNTYTGGPLQQAVSTTTMLNNQWYDGIEYQKYSFEYAPGGDKNAFVAWVVGDDQETMKFDARAIGPNGNIGQRLVSEEPLAMNLNLGFSHSWVDVQFDQLKFPTIMRIDYVRWYQKEGDEMVTCDPPGYETTQYIADHPLAYQNPNVTTWEQAGYTRPKNSLMDGCKAAPPVSTGSSRNNKK